MKRNEIILILVMAITLAFCSAVTAHPGHGTEYPEEINITTPDPGTGSTTSTSGTSSSTSKSSTSSGKKSMQTENTASKTTTDDDNGDQSAGYASNPEEITSRGSNTNESNATPESSNNSPWSTAAIVGFLVVGLGAIGFFFKDRFSH